MKKSSVKKLLSLLLCLLLIGAVFCAVIPTASAADIKIQNGTGNREPIRIGKSFSYRAIINSEFTGFGFHMPTWEKTTSYATLSLYKWEGSHAKSIAAEPIATQKFDPLKDSHCHWVEFSAQPAGEYLFHISDVSADAGVWTNTSPQNSKGFLYIDGIEQRGEPELVIRFPDSPTDPFGTCEASGDIRSPQYPYNNQSGEAVFDMNGPLGLQLKVTAPFTGVQFKMATYMATDMEVDMSVYAWKGSYEASTAEPALASKRLLLVDNAVQGVIFDEEIPAGEYLFLTENYNKSPAMYVYTSVNNFKGLVYKDGFPWENNVQYPVMQVIFNAEQEEFYEQVSEPEDSITGDHVTPPAYVIPEDSLIYTHPVDPSTWVFTDGLGRVSLTSADVGLPKEDKTLAMFYWTWHIGGFVNHLPANLQQLSEQYPEAMRDFDNPLWDGKNSFWWNESIYGFYRTDDQWVLRKQAELLANAGVDVIFTDNTNGESTWRDSYTALMEAWTNAMDDGLLTPKVSFMLPFWDKSYTNIQVQSIYLDIFRANKWNNLWFYWDDKPMLMAIKESFDPNASLVDKEIANFFTFRAGQPDYLYHPAKKELGSWGWLSMYPQATYTGTRDNVMEGKVEQITVGIAQNHDYVNKALAAMSGNNIAGRSYSSKYPNRYAEEGAEASKWGYNFSEQWEYALEVDPKVVFVTGWNEFRVGRYEQWPENEGNPAAVENAFPDQYNDEFSRDIEPTKGALKDHYYYQLVNYARQFKGASPIPTPSTNATIDMNAGQEQWANVAPYYAAYIGNTEDRNAPGYGDLVYTETSGRNDIIGAQIARDDQFVYFHVECADNITPYTDNLWMTLYIDSDQANQGWETFEYVINKSAASENTVVLEKFTGDGYASQKVADCEYKVDGRYMTVKVAKSDLGLSGNDYTINFSWTDNVHDEDDATKFSGDIMDFYISGDVAPGARFKYSYISTEANATGKEPGTDESDTSESNTADSEPTDPESEPASEPASEPTTDEPIKGTDAVTDTSTSAVSNATTEEEGCASSAAAAGVITAAMAAAVALRKRKEN